MKTAAVAVLAFCVFFSACDVTYHVPEDLTGRLPQRVLVDQTFTNVERDAILRAMDVWNDVTEPYREDKTPLFEYVGPVADAFSAEDGNDDTVVAYNVILDREQKYWLEEAAVKVPDAIGLSIGNDIAVPTFSFSDKEKEDGGYGQFIEFIAIHEFGHFLGIGHLDVAAIMYPYLTGIVDDAGNPTLAEADIKAFCELYACY